MAEDVAVRVVIEGRVQGVGFRWWIMKGAAAHGLGGWVRNRRGGLTNRKYLLPTIGILSGAWR
jgi:acylphosphatase